jgi:hypothetical protein
MVPERPPLLCGWVDFDLGLKCSGVCALLTYSSALLSRGARGPTRSSGFAVPLPSAATTSDARPFRRNGIPSQTGRMSERPPALLLSSTSNSSPLIRGRQHFHSVKLDCSQWMKRIRKHRGSKPPEPEVSESLIAVLSDSR